MSASAEEEVFVPFPAPIERLGTATLVRTTLLVSSLQSVRKRNLTDRYLELLPVEHHAMMQSMIAGQWTAMKLAESHYATCDALGFSETAAHQIGTEVGDRIQGTFLAAMVRMVGTVGVTPWTALSHAQTLFERVFRGGGGLSVVKRGPKDARVHFVGVPLCRFRYYRGALAGVFEAAADLFCRKSYAKEVAGSATKTSVAFHISWA
jgi:hypothetical protein